MPIALAAALLAVAAAGCGGSGSAPHTAPLAQVHRPSGAFGAKISTICEGGYWQLQRYFAGRSRPHIDMPSILDTTVARLRRLQPPANETAAFDQLTDSLVQIENLSASADAAAAGAATLDAEVQSLSQMAQVMTEPSRRVAALAKEMLAPGCRDVVDGRSWRRLRP